MSDDPPTVGVILAGGLARRMQGQDKSSCLVGGRMVLTRILDRVRPQVSAIALNTNGEPPAALGIALLPDDLAGHPGPLAGVLAALDWAHREHLADWVLTTPCDTPFLPPDLVARLHAGRRMARAVLAVAASGGRAHPTIALWPTALRDALRHALTVENVRKVDLFSARHARATVEWAMGDRDPFFNINTPADLRRATLLDPTPREPA